MARKVQGHALKEGMIIRTPRISIEGIELWTMFRPEVGIHEDSIKEDAGPFMLVKYWDWELGESELVPYPDASVGQGSWQHNVFEYEMPFTVVTKREVERELAKSAKMGVGESIQRGLSGPRRTRPETAEFIRRGLEGTQPDIFASMRRYQRGPTPATDPDPNPVRMTREDKRLIENCRKKWQRYHAFPTRDNLADVGRHLIAMRESNSRRVAAERWRCARNYRPEVREWIEMEMRGEVDPAPVPDWAPLVDEERERAELAEVALPEKLGRRTMRHLEPEIRRLERAMANNPGTFLAADVKPDELYTPKYYKSKTQAGRIGRTYYVRTGGSKRWIEVGTNKASLPGGAGAWEAVAVPKPAKKKASKKKASKKKAKKNPKRNARPKFTYKKAREHILTVLDGAGWDISPSLKVPHATAPYTETVEGRLYFKPQAIWYSSARRPSMSTARSINPQMDPDYDMRTLAALSNEDLIATLKRLMTVYKNPGRGRRGAVPNPPGDPSSTLDGVSDEDRAKLMDIMTESLGAGMSRTDFVRNWTRAVRRGMSVDDFGVEMRLLVAGIPSAPPPPTPAPPAGPRERHPARGAGPSEVRGTGSRGGGSGSGQRSGSGVPWGRWGKQAGKGALKAGGWTLGTIGRGVWAGAKLGARGLAGAAGAGVASLRETMADYNVPDGLVWNADIDPGYVKEVFTGEREAGGGRVFPYADRGWHAVGSDAFSNSKVRIVSGDFGQDSDGNPLFDITVGGRRKVTYEKVLTAIAKEAKKRNRTLRPKLQAFAGLQLAGEEDGVPVFVATFFESAGAHAPEYAPGWAPTSAPAALPPTSPAAPRGAPAVVFVDRARDEDIAAAAGGALEPFSGDVATAEFVANPGATPLERAIYERLVKWGRSRSGELAGIVTMSGPYEYVMTQEPARKDVSKALRSLRKQGLVRLTPGGRHWEIVPK
jgi:hypothetical protein